MLADALPDQLRATDFGYRGDNERRQCSSYTHMVNRRRARRSVPQYE